MKTVLTLLTLMWTAPALGASLFAALPDNGCALASKDGNAVVCTALIDQTWEVTARKRVWQRGWHHTTDLLLRHKRPGKPTAAEIARVEGALAKLGVGTKHVEMLRGKKTWHAPFGRRLELRGEELTFVTESKDGTIERGRLVRTQAMTVGAVAYVKGGQRFVVALRLKGFVKFVDVTAPPRVAMAGMGSTFEQGKGGMGFKGGGFGRIHGVGTIKTTRSKQKRIPGRIKLGQYTVDGTCEKSDFRKVFRRRANSLRACYEQRLQKDPKLEGTVTVALTIVENGRTTDVRAEKATLKNKGVVACFLRVTRRMAFPKPQKGTCSATQTVALTPAK